jgi:hypothetical protein
MKKTHEEEIAELMEEIKQKLDLKKDPEKNLEELLVEVLAYNKLILEKLTNYTGK